MSLEKNVILDSVRAEANRSKRPDRLQTDCPFWPHLSVAADGFRSAVSMLPERLRRRVLNAFLRALAIRIDTAARQVLVFESSIEAAIRGSSVSISDLTVEWRNDSRPVAALLDAYPALSNLLVVFIQNAICFCARVSGELISNFRSAHEEIFGRAGLDLEDIEDVELLTSDPHAGGQTVIVFRDANGAGLMAYKPRSVDIEARLTQSIKDLLRSEGQLTTSWTLPRYSCKENSGWVEWIESQSCASEREVSVYYARAGMLLAWSVALGVTDLHRDNLVSSAASPVPVDLETSFHHRQRPDAPSRLGLVLPRVMEWNSLATGLLPVWIWKGEDRTGVDLSGLGSLAEQWCSFPVQQFVERGTPSERLIRDGVKLYPGRNGVRLADCQIFPWDYIQEIVDGFALGSKLLSENNSYLSELADQTGRMETRFLARPTAGYHYAIMASLHPSYVRSEQLRRAFLNSALQNSDRIQGWILDAEVNACEAGDIPRFTTRPGSRLVTERHYGTTGELPADEHIAGLEAVLSDAKFLVKAERMTFEKRLISGALLSLKTAHLPGDMNRALLERDAIDGVNAIAAANSAAQLIADFTEQNSDPALWYGFREAPGAHYEFGLLGTDFYSGISGIAYGLSIAVEHGFVQLDRAVGVAKRISSVIQNRLQIPEYRLGGAYFGEISGVIGVAAALSRLGQQSTAQGLVASAILAIETALENKRAERHFWGLDLLGGVAGALAAFVALFQAYRQERCLRVIESLILFLLSRCRRVDGFLVAEQPGISSGPQQALCGLSHGQAGIALALAEAAALEELSRNVRENSGRSCMDIVRWELLQFNETAMNFPDYRHRATRPREGEIAWSHGALGTYYALLRIIECLPLAEVSEFLLSHPITKVTDHALEFAPSPANASISHGAIGSYHLMSALLSAAGAWNEGWEARLLRWTRLEAWAEFETRPLRQHVIDPPGCMVGRSGSLIGWLAFASKSTNSIPFSIRSILRI